MKILVDELPETWHQCPDHVVNYCDSRPIGENLINGCKKANRNFECKIGEPGFVCPYYAEFGEVINKRLNHAVVPISLR